MQYSYQYILELIHQLQEAERNQWSDDLRYYLEKFDLLYYVSRVISYFK